jgi:hypothetical protein
MKDVFARCLEKTAVQVCIIVVSLSLHRLVSTYRTSIPVSGKPKHDIYCFFIFRRLKINHDIHEFILDSGTIVNRKEARKDVQR